MGKEVGFEGWIISNLGIDEGIVVRLCFVVVYFGKVFFFRGEVYLYLRLFEGLGVLGGNFGNDMCCYISIG